MAQDTPSPAEVLAHEFIPGTVHLVDLEGTLRAKHSSTGRKDIVLVPAPSNDSDDPLNILCPRLPAIANVMILLNQKAPEASCAHPRNSCRVLNTRRGLARVEVTVTFHPYVRRRRMVVINMWRECSIKHHITCSKRSGRCSTTKTTFPLQLHILSPALRAGSKISSPLSSTREEYDEKRGPHKEGRFPKIPQTLKNVSGFKS
jgi:hypothetical protein